MTARNVEQLAACPHDLLIVGGGIYGVCMALEAAGRGMKPLLIERDDFGGATSLNSLRIVHGGLRYLQSLDLTRFRESIAERRWFLQHLPDLVQPLRCIMPLYGRGLKRPSVMRAALLLNDLLSFDRNRGVQADRMLSRGCVLNRSQTQQLFPAVSSDGLLGAGQWFDAAMRSPQRVLMELLRWASARGAQAINYMQAVDVVVDNGKVRGIEAVDRLTGRTQRFTAERVINCAGPWSRAFCATAAEDRPALFRTSLAFNVLLGIEPPSEAAVAVVPRGKGEPIYFLYPCGAGVLAGTVHLPWQGETDEPRVSDEQLGAFLDDLNDAIPGFGVTREHVLRTMPGFLPTNREGSNELSKRPVVIDHSREGGPAGLVSLAGVKYTTARLVAERVVQMIARDSRTAAGPAMRGGPRPAALEQPGIDLIDPATLLAADDSAVRTLGERLMVDEHATSARDIVERRSSWGDDPRMGEQVAARLMALLPQLGDGAVDQTAPQGEATAQPGGA